MTDTNPKKAQVGVIDPATGQPHPTSGPKGGPEGATAGTQARDVATRGTAHASDGPSGQAAGAAGQAQQKAQQAAGTAQDKAQQAAGTAQEKAQQAAGQAQEKAQEAAGQARSQIQQQLDQRSTQAGERVTATAGDLRSISDQLREQGNAAPAKLADTAALQVEKVGSYLQRTDGSSLLHDVEGFARRNPWATALGGLAVGFAASRALKASSTDRHQASSGQGSRPAAGPGVGTGTPYGTSPSRLGDAHTTPPYPSAPGGTPGVAIPGTAGTPTAVTTGYSVPSGAPGQPGTATNPGESRTGS